MDININEIINTHINKIEKKEEKPFLLVWKGFTNEIYLHITLEKLLSTPIKMDIVELDQSKAKLLQEMIQKQGEHGPEGYWCTFEEYLLLGEEILSLYFTIVIFENNIFYKTYPALYQIPEIERIYTTYYAENMENDANEDDPIYEVVQKYYGEIKSVGSSCFVVYAYDVEAIPFFSGSSQSILERKLQSHETVDIELSEVEDEFLKLTQDLLARNYLKKELLVSYSGELDYYNYLERLHLLQSLFPDIHFVLITKITEPKPDIDETEYLRILKKYWGFDSFRSLRMYKDIHDPDFKKETTEVPQSQIIHDIVKQAEIAHQGGTYKDIFVTSPTGAGKSIMFQIPAIYLAEKYQLMTIVISPLIGLMTDQVQGLINRNVDISATINSEISPAEKMDIIEKIQEGKISILYISPETLLSRSDIAQLIGERKVGLFVIDEAHIVTTWGKAFRSDYWYLGNYLQRLRKDMQFPVATFTATAIYGGIEDMYAETRDSLNLINPISYFGYIKRDDLKVRIKQKDHTKERFQEYLDEKFKILTYRLERFLEKGQKTLVYFPLISLIHAFTDFAKGYGSEKLNQHLSVYYGTLNKDEKQNNYLRFKNNDSLIMLATKAFGMGIDIPDIVNVYHFSPTGNVCDYVQEIGRAARSLEQGYAYFDFLPKDFVHVNRLHGISTIRKHQLVQVMAKILQILDRDQNRKNIRSLLVNAEEFRYIFEQRNESDGNEDVDNKLKTALLIIEKDFKAKLGYSPIVARPRSIFAREYFMIQRDQEDGIIRQFGKYFEFVREKSPSFYGNVYRCNMKKLWEDYFENLSFPQFKYRFHTKDPVLQLPFLDHILSVLQIELFSKAKNESDFFTNLNYQLDQIASILGVYAKEKKYFSIEDVAKDVRSIMGKDKYAAQNLASILIHSAENYERVMRRNSNFYNRFITYNEGRGKYTIQHSGYAGFVDWIKQEARQLINPANLMNREDLIYEVFLPKMNRVRIEKTFILLGILEVLGLLLYRANGGDKPEIFIRINSRFQLERSLHDPDRYRNYILENVYQRHKISVAMLTYLFRNEVDNDTFWEHIENYFLGKIPDEVMSEVRNQ